MQALNSFTVTWAGAKSVDMGATVNSDPFIVSSYPGFSINPSWTTGASPVGTLDVQVCNTPRVGGATTLMPNDTQNWVTLSALQAKPGTDTPPGIQQVFPNTYSWCRLKYTRTSGGAGDTLSAQAQGVTT